MPDGRTGYIHIKTYILRQFPVAVLASEMSLADMDRFISGIVQHTGQCYIILRDTFPVPVCRTERCFVICFRIDPVGRSVSGRVLAGHDRCTGRRTDTLRIESRKANPLTGHTLHIRSLIPVVQRITDRITCLIRQKRKRSIHKAHIIDQKNNNIRTFLCHKRLSG